MTDEEALKIIEAWADVKYEPTRNAARIAISALRERIGRQNGCWIPVKGRPPDRNGRYLVSLGVKAPEELGGNQTLVRIIRYFEGEWKYPVHLPTWINKEITQEITYWRPLPEPPEAITDDAL